MNTQNGNNVICEKLRKEVANYDAVTKQRRKDRARVATLHARIKNYEKKITETRKEYFALIDSKSSKEPIVFWGREDRREFIQKLDERFGKVNRRTR